MTRHIIHVVEDDEALRVSLELLLSLSEELDVHSHVSGDAFLAALDSVEAGVVLLDYRMPGKSGTDVLSEIAGDVRFATVMLTGQGDVALAVQAMKLGAVDFLEKPTDRANLMRAIDLAITTLAQRRDQSADQNAAHALVTRLSSREMDVFRGLVCGWSNKAIAHRLGVSPRTIEVHRANMMNKLEVRSLSDALRVAFAAKVADTFLAEGL